MENQSLHHHEPDMHSRSAPSPLRMPMTVNIVVNARADCLTAAQLARDLVPSLQQLINRGHLRRDPPQEDTPDVPPDAPTGEKG